MIPLSKISLAETFTKIERIRDLDLNTATIDEVKSHVQDAFQSHTFQYVNISDVRFFRGRVHQDDQLFKNIDELLEPPRQFSKNGRANREGDSILYVGNELGSILEELTPKDGAFVTMLELHLKKHSHLSLFEFGIAEHSNDQALLNIVRKAEQFIATNDGYEQLAKQKIVRSFIKDEFIRFVDEKNPQQYKLSIAVAEHLLAASQVDGFMYPTVKAGLRGINCVIKPKRAREVLRPFRADILKIERKHGRMRFQHVGTAKEFTHPIQYTTPQDDFRWEVDLDHETR